MNIEFIASFAPVTADPVASRDFYVGSLGLALDHAEGDDYIHSERIDGTNISAFGRSPRRLKPASVRLTGRPTSRRRKPPSNSRWPIPTRSRPLPPNSGTRAMTCCTRLG